MKLFVAGCSFSDYTKVNKTYGELLADMLNLEYVHCAAGCGSNYRIWRVIGNHILEGNLTPSDLVIIQYTTPERKEFWSKFESNISVSEKYKNYGTLIRFKADSFSWQDVSEQKTFMKLYEENFLNIDYEKEKIKLYHNMFQHFLLNSKIKTIFLKSSYYFNNFNNINEGTLLEPFEKLSFRWEKNKKGSDISLDPDVDWFHLSEKGHDVLASDLRCHLREMKII